MAALPRLLRASRSSVGDTVQLRPLGAVLLVLLPCGGSVGLLGSLLARFELASPTAHVHMPVSRTGPHARQAVSPAANVWNHETKPMHTRLCNFARVVMET